MAPHNHRINALFPACLICLSVALTVTALPVYADSLGQAKQLIRTKQFTKAQHMLEKLANAGDTEA